jgi:7-carboxy-7-deazaguanine synthase
VSETLVVNEIYLSLQGESTFAGLPCIFVRLTACNLRCSYCDTAYAFTEGKKQSLAEILNEIRRLAEPFKKSGGAVEQPIPPRPAVLSPVAGGENAPKRFSRTDPLNHPSCFSPPPPLGERAGVRGVRPSEVHGEGPGEGGPSAIPQKNLSLPLIELTGGEPLLQPNALPLMKALCDNGFTVLIETSGALDISQVDPRVRRIMDLKCPGSGEVKRNRWANLPHLKATDEIKFVIGAVEDYEWAKRQIAERNLAAICPLLMSWVQPLAPEQQDKSLKRVPAGQTPISRRDLAERIIADALPVRFQAQLHKLIWPPEQRGV